MSARPTPLFWPFWHQPCINTHDTLEKAEQYAGKLMKGRVVKYL